MSEALHQTTQTIADGQAILAHGALIGDREGQLDTATFELLRASGGARLPLHQRRLRSALITS